MIREAANTGGDTADRMNTFLGSQRVMSTGQNGNTIQAFNLSNTSIKPILLILDSRSTLNLVHYPNDLENLRGIPGTMVINCNTGTSRTSTVGYLRYYKYHGMWYHPG